MKAAIAAFVALLLPACASPTAVIDERSMECGPGRDVEIRSGIDAPGTISEMQSAYTFLVEVANNSHQDVTVTSVRIEPTRTRSGRPSRIAQVHQAYDQLIPEGTEHVFKIPGRSFAGVVSAPDAMARTDEHEYRVSVQLSNGDSYHCLFLAEL